MSYKEVRHGRGSAQTECEKGAPGGIGGGRGVGGKGPLRALSLSAATAASNHDHSFSFFLNITITPIKGYVCNQKGVKRGTEQAPALLKSP
jgi:hypothetical protein